MTVRHWVFIASLLVVGVGAASLTDFSSAPPEATTAEVGEPRPLPGPAGPSELALVAPLVPGSDLAGWTVESIEGVDHGAMALMLQRGEERTRLQIALGDPGGALAPTSAGRYAIYFAGTSDGAMNDGADTHALTTALQAVIAAHPDVDPPAGLGPLAVVAREGT